ncbi:MAG TPA: MarR family transcriptional regulator [Gaiellaceae bacterium]|nr:MarR family transcriptional regulator [Gaiellaceae bacterium]
MSEQTSGVQAFSALLRGYAAATRQLNAQLTADHGLTISDYEVLLRLARAPERQMRRVDLAEQVLLTASGITRLLDGLEGSGLVARGSCDTDRRVVYAVLTDSGLAKLREASASHLAQIDAFFAARFDDGELGDLSALLTRLADGEPAVCEPAA